MDYRSDHYRRQGRVSFVDGDMCADVRVNTHRSSLRPYNVARPLTVIDGRTNSEYNM